MAEAEARVLGAGISIEVDGQEYSLLPISMKSLQEVQRKAVTFWKRQYLASFSENIDVLGLAEDVKTSMLVEKLDKVAKMGIDDIPKKKAYDSSVCDVKKKKLMALITEKMGQKPESPEQAEAFLSQGLDSEEILPLEVKAACGIMPRWYKIPYDSWWATACYEGAIAMVAASLEEDGVDCGGWPIRKIMEAASIVEKLTAPAIKNT